MTRNDELTMLEIMQRWPRTVPVIIRLGLYCAGCPVAGFHTLADAARLHALDLAELEAALHPLMKPVSASARRPVPSIRADRVPAASGGRL